MAKKMLMKFGHPVIMDGAIVFVEEGDAALCHCCEVVGGPCSECFEAMERITATFADTPSGSQMCACFPFDDVPHEAYSWDGSYVLDEELDFGLVKLFSLTLGEEADLFQDITTLGALGPGRLVDFQAAFPCNFARSWTYLYAIRATVECVDGLLTVTVSALFQTFSNGTGPTICIGHSTVSFGSVQIDTTNDCEECGTLDPPTPWDLRCNPGAEPTESGETTVTINCHISDPPDDPPPDPDPPPEDPDPPEDPPDPPDPPFEDDSDCSGLDDCMSMPDLRLNFSDLNNVTTAFTTHDIFGGGVSGDYNWLLENLNWENAGELTLPSIGGGLWEIELYTSGDTYAVASTDGILIRQDSIDPGSGFDPDPGCEVYAQRIRVAVACEEDEDGNPRARITLIEVSGDAYTKSNGSAFTFFGVLAVGSFDDPTYITDHILKAVVSDCETGWMVCQVEFDDTFLVPSAGTTHNFNAMAKVG